MTLVYLDCETSGLDPDVHQVWEIAWAVDDGDIRSGFVRHDLAHADVDALRLGRYRDRYQPPVARAPLEADLIEQLRDATLVGANPAFDAAFLRHRWGFAPWKYRLLDVEAYAMPWLGLTTPRGLAYIAEQLHTTPPDHTAAGDVQTLRECHRTLDALYRGRSLLLPVAPRPSDG